MRKILILHLMKMKYLCVLYQFFYLKEDDAKKMDKIIAINIKKYNL